MGVLTRLGGVDSWVFPSGSAKPFRDFSRSKRTLDELSGVTEWRLHDLRRTCVSGMARLGIAPHIADKVLNHQSGTISGVAAVYQRHEFLAERQEALDRWGAHVAGVIAKAMDIDSAPVRTLPHSLLIRIPPAPADSPDWTNRNPAFRPRDHERGAST